MVTTTKHKLYSLTEGETVVRLDWKNLPDLDALMLDIVAELAIEYPMSEDWEEDEPTAIRSWSREPDWQWARISPCTCGEHGWHWDSRRITDEDAAFEDHPPRRFLALSFEGE